jgi:hypothetical protein
MQLEDLVEQSAIEAAVGLFQAYNVRLVCADVTERAVMSNTALCGVVGFVGKKVSGTLLLAATAGPVSASNPSSATARDWMAELSNQLFGRIKNRLLRKGLELIGAPPAVIQGGHLEALTDRKECRPIVLRGPTGGKVCIWLDYAMEADLPVTLEDVDPADEIPLEGSVLLF